ncbi:MAG: hypothetical protein KC766_21735 [Myxococcales bacterium]|nr:hypothetical protein [Myxococcales bacterium]
MMEAKRSFNGVRVALSGVFAAGLALSAIQCSADSGSASQVGNGGSGGSSGSGNDARPARPLRPANRGAPTG